MKGPTGLSLGATAVIVTVVIANLGNNIVAPIMPAIRSEFGSTAAEVGLVASGFGIGRLVMDLPAGYLTDRMSSSRLFTAGILVAALAAGLAAFSTTLQQLILFRTAMGFGSAIMTTVALILMVNIARPEQRGAVLGFYFSAMLLGQAISPSIGGYLGAAFGWRAAFLFCALTPFLSLPLNLATASRVGAAGSGAGESRVGKHRARRGGEKGANPASTNRPALIAVYFSVFANFFNRQGMRQAILPLYGAMVLGMDPGSMGAILTTGSILTIVINLPSGFAADRIGRKIMLLPGLAVLGAGNLFLLSGGSQWTFVAATVLVSMGVLANSMQSGLVADLVPERLVGRGLGMYRFVADLGVVVGPVVLGLVLDHFGFSAAAITGSLVVLAALAGILVVVPRRTIGVPQEADG